MLAGFQAGVSGVYYNQEKLSAISNNLANTDTTGFRRALAVQMVRQKSHIMPLEDTWVRPRHPRNYGIEREGVFVNHQEGGTQVITENPMDLAIDPKLNNAYFAVRRTDDPSRTYYTRNGKLSIGPLDPSEPGSQSVLYTAGHILLDATGNPIAVTGSGPLTIQSSGIINQGEESIGQLGIYRMNKYPDESRLIDSPLSLLERMGNSLYNIPEDFREEFHPMVIQAQEGQSHLMRQGAVEGSNINIVSELVEMMQAQKSSNANRIALNTHMEGLSKLFQAVRA